MQHYVQLLSTQQCWVIMIHLQTLSLSSRSEVAQHFADALLVGLAIQASPKAQAACDDSDRVTVVMTQTLLV
jgi:hypothetical protein